jgi:hypothetical protein
MKGISKPTACIDDPFSSDRSLIGGHIPGSVFPQLHVRHLGLLEDLGTVGSSSLGDGLGQTVGINMTIRRSKKSGQDLKKTI